MRARWRRLAACIAGSVALILGLLGCGSSPTSGDVTDGAMATPGPTADESVTSSPSEGSPAGQCSNLSPEVASRALPPGKDLDGSVREEPEYQRCVYTAMGNEYYVILTQSSPNCDSLPGNSLPSGATVVSVSGFPGSACTVHYLQGRGGAVSQTIWSVGDAAFSIQLSAAKDSADYTDRTTEIALVLASS